MTDVISDGAHVMASAAKGDPRISLGDIVDMMQAETALRDWAERITFDRAKAAQTLLQQYPHLQQSVP